MQADVERALETLLARGERFDFSAVRAVAAPEKPLVPHIDIPPPELPIYDPLLVGGAR
jgi:hypothetical protein